MDSNATTSLFSTSHQSQIRNNVSGIFKRKLQSIFASSDIRNGFSPDFANRIDPDAFYTLNVPAHLEKSYKRGELHWVISQQSKQPTGQLADRQGKFRGTGIMEKADGSSNAIAGADESSMTQIKEQNRIMIGQMNQIKEQSRIIIGQLNQIKLQNAAIMQQLMQITEIVSDK